MNFRYLVMLLNGKKILDHLLISSNQDYIFTKKRLQAITKKIVTLEENALLYQLGCVLYEATNDALTFDIDRDSYKCGNASSIKKINELVLPHLFYVDLSSVFSDNNLLKKDVYIQELQHLYQEGFVIEFDNNLRTRFVPYHKSGSMGRKSVISFISEPLKVQLDKRLNFDIISSNKKYNLSKLQAYLGLYFSSGIRVEVPQFNEESVVVVQDFYLQDVITSYTTAISRSWLIDYINQFLFTTDSKLVKSDYVFLRSLIDHNSKHNDDREDDAFFELLNLVRSTALETLHKGKLSPSQIIEQIDTLSMGEYSDVINYLYYHLGFDNPLLADDQLLHFKDVIIRTETNMFDGEGFIDRSYLEQINQQVLRVSEPPYHNSIQFRLPFTKGVLHAFDISSWCKEFGLTHIVDAFNIFRDVSKIKVILSVSQFKCYNWLKDSSLTMSDYFNHFQQYRHAMYITNLDKRESDSLDTILNYQLLHTPALKYSDFLKLLEKSTKHYKEFMTTPSKQREFFIKSKEYLDNTAIDYQVDDDDYEILVRMLTQNPMLVHEPIFQARIKSFGKTLLKNLKVGRIQVDGALRFLSGDLLDFIIKISQRSSQALFFDDKISEESQAILNLPLLTPLQGYFYAPSNYNHFRKGTPYSILRNPHLTSKELVSVSPVNPDSTSLRSRYFSHLTGVVMLNTFTNQMLAMQTADTDGDMVRIITDPIYNQAVIESNKQDENQRILTLPLPSVSKIPTPENMFDALVLSLSTRIGLISNYAFTHSIHAFNENNPNDKTRVTQKKETELASMILSAEIDSVKSGTSPHFNSRVDYNPFIKYKNVIEANKNDTVNFKLDDTSPNLYYLKNIAEKLNTDTQLLLKSVRKPKYTIFTFENDPHWEKSLNQSLLKQIAKHIIAYSDWNRSFSYYSLDESQLQSTLSTTIDYILSAQYDDISWTLVYDSIIEKLLVLSLADLTETRNHILINEWHFSITTSEKEELIELLLPELLSDEEKELLFNFSQAGHKLLYLILTYTISMKESEYTNQFREFDSITRYKASLTQIFLRNSINVNLVDDLMVSVIENHATLNDIFVTYINPNLSSASTTDNSKAKEICEKLFKSYAKINLLKFNFSTDDISHISDLAMKYNRLMFDDNQILYPTWKVKLDLQNLINHQLDDLFQSYGIDRKEEIKYYYGLKQVDKSLRFLTTFGKNTMFFWLIKSEYGGENHVK